MVAEVAPHVDVSVTACCSDQVCGHTCDSTSSTVADSQPASGQPGDSKPCTSCAAPAATRLHCARALGKPISASRSQADSHRQW
jgi:hypothetical protein